VTTTDPAGLKSDPLEGDDQESWMKSWWRPAMCWQYLFICMCDFFFFPMANNVIYAAWGVEYHEWHPMTLQGGGVYHMAMGGIVGSAVWNRTQEKIRGMTMGTSSVTTRTVEQSTNIGASVVPSAMDRSSRAD
jgi:hypothetical protein